MQKKKTNNALSIKYILLLMTLAYIFSYVIRLIWVYQFQGNPSFYWDGQLMINTNDGYYFASGAQTVLEGLHLDNPRIPNVWQYGVVFFTVLLTKITPFSLETITLYMPTLISSIVVVPIMLISRLYGQALWGFFAALLGSIAWSYYNRTMTGYYDTDMFSAMAPMFILYFLMKSTIDFTLKSALFAAIAIAVYPFLYDQGKSIVNAMGLIYAFYMFMYHRNDTNTYYSMILVFFALLPLPIIAPFNYIVKIIVLVMLYFFFKRTKIPQKKLMVASGILLISFMYFGNVFSLMINKTMDYIVTGTEVSGLHFYGVHQTVREAGKIPFNTFANRISGSEIGLLLSFIGYILLVIRHKAFILALPLIGIGIFALWGGLRFTVYAVPIAAMSAIYLFFIIGDLFKDGKLKYGFIVVATAMMLYPNITHIIGYRVPTVLKNAEVKDLAKLNTIANEKDYTLSWWDYGYPLWYYSDTNTLIDGGKHQNDNFIISTIMQTPSAELAANFSRLAVETYVEGVESHKKYLADNNEEKIPAKFKMQNNEGDIYHAGIGPVADVLFRNKQKDQKDPNLMLADMDSSNYKLPKKTRDIYLYLPYRMLNIFPTVAIFGNLDLTTGKTKRKISFYPTSVRSSGKDGVVILNNGIVVDTKKGEIRLGKETKTLTHFIVTQDTPTGKVKLFSQMFHLDGEYSAVYMKSHGNFIVMDNQTFNSTYVQMFILGKYDKNLFDLVVSSPYSKIYKLKK